MRLWGRRITRQGAVPRPTGLNPEAQRKFDDCVEQFARDLLDEVERIEAGQSASEGKPEITSTMVLDGNLYVRRAYGRRRRSYAVLGAQLVSGAALILVGVATENLDKRWGQILFAVGVCVALVAGAAAWVKEA